MTRREFTREELAIVDEYRKKMEAAKTPQEVANLCRELGRELNLPDPENFIS